VYNNIILSARQNLKKDAKPPPRGPCRRRHRVDIHLGMLSGGIVRRPAIRTRLDQPGRQTAARVVRPGQVWGVHPLGRVLGAGVRQRMVLDELET